MRPARATVVRRWAFLGLALALAIGAGQLLPTLNRQRDKLGLVGPTEIGKVTPGLALAVTASGPARAIAINILWMRATRLQEDGRFFELNQLCNLITGLEPRLPMVWAHWAWNLAYNVSVKFPVEHPITPEQADKRWRWIQNGLDVLRHRGIPYNPRASYLYKELAWIYDHKIGGSSDEAHSYYKVRVATEMHYLLGDAPHRGRLEAVAAAPESRVELLRDEGVRDLVQRIRQAGIDPFDEPLAVVARAPRLPEAVRTVLKAPAHQAAAARLDDFLRADYLRRRLKMDPAYMRRLMAIYGPIDWRLPSAHALYWARRGVDVLGEQVDQAANTDRIVFHAVNGLYRGGTLLFTPGTESEPPTWIPSPNFAFIDVVIQTYEYILSRYEKSNQPDPVREGYLNFLREVSLDLYIYGDTRRSQHYHRILHDQYDERREYLEFISWRLRERHKAQTHEDVRNIAEGFFYQSLGWASLGENDKATGHDRAARLLHKQYEAEHADRLKLPPVRELWMNALRRAFLTFPPDQVERLRELYPQAVRQVEKEFEQERERLRRERERLERERAEGAAPRPSTATPPR